MAQFINTARKTFQSYKQLAEKAMSQMSDDQLNWQPNVESNSVVTIVKHLSGNMLSRWTDFLTTDGEKETRDRDAEFETEQMSPGIIVAKWEEGWQCLFNALDSLTEADLDRTVYIRGEAHTVLEAITRQIAHYSSHVGQIIYIAKLQVTDWQALTIPKNASRQFNAEMMARQLPGG